MSKSPITCHVLDSSTGKPADNVKVSLQFAAQTRATGATNEDGRCLNLLSPDDTLSAGVYKITFFTKDYFVATGRKCFYPYVEITFELENPEEHYHIPLLISPYSYTTYRGS